MSFPFKDGTTHLQFIGALNFVRRVCDCRKTSVYFCNICGQVFCEACSDKHPEHPRWD